MLLCYFDNQLLLQIRKTFLILPKDAQGNIKISETLLLIYRTPQTYYKRCFVYCWKYRKNCFLWKTSHFTQNLTPFYNSIQTFFRKFGYNKIKLCMADKLFSVTNEQLLTFGCLTFTYTWMDWLMMQMMREMLTCNHVRKKTQMKMCFWQLI